MLADSTTLRAHACIAKGERNMSLAEVHDPFMLDANSLSGTIHPVLHAQPSFGIENFAQCLTKVCFPLQESDLGLRDLKAAWSE